MRRSLIDVEYDVNLIEEDVRRKYDLERDWQGDCRSDDIQLLITKLCCCADEEYDNWLDEVRYEFERQASFLNK